MILFSARFSLPSVSVPPFLTEQPQTAASFSRERRRWVIGEAMRLGCDARSPFRICLLRAQTFWQSTGRASLIVQQVPSFRSRLDSRSNSTPAVFAIRDFF